MKKAAQSVILEDAFYVIAAPNGRVLEVANFNPDNGAAVQLWDYAGEPWQQWSFVPVGGGYYIKNRFTGKVIDLALRGTAKGTLLHQWSETGHTSQQWKLEPASRGTRIRSVLAGKCLDLSELSTANGARAQIWEDVEGGSQEWSIRRVNAAKEGSAPAKAPVPQGAERAGALRESALVRKIGGKERASKHRGKK